MVKEKFNPKTSPAVVIRYLPKDPGKNEIVKRVNGETEAKEWLAKLNKEEKAPDKYCYLWQWNDPEAARLRNRTA